MEVEALDFRALWDALTSGEDFDMCYTEKTCIPVDGDISGGLVIGVIAAEVCFWLYLAITARILIRRARRKRLKANHREFERVLRGP